MPSINAKKFIRPILEDSLKPDEDDYQD